MAHGSLHGPLAGDYTSEFSDLESEAEVEKRTLQKSTKELYKKPFTEQKVGLFHSTGDKRLRKPPKKDVFTNELEKNEGKRMRYHGILAMDAFTRHQKFVNDYLLYYGGKREDFKATQSKIRTDADIIRENNKFLWDDREDEDSTWEKRLAKKYWNKLFKEYAITDLSRFKENKVALRWRIEKEVVSGKGQFSCGNKHCKEDEGLRSWEVNFGYVEDGEKKNALVKLRLCAECSYKLNYHHKKKEIKNRKQLLKEAEKRDKKHKKHTKEKIEEKKSKIDEDKNESEIWARPVKIEQEKTREEEFDSYFEDLLL